MPALPDVPNVIRLQLRHTVNLDLDVLSRVYLQYSGTAPTSAQLTTSAATIFTSWGTNLKAFAVSEVILTEVVLTDLTSATAGEGIQTGSTAGTRTGSFLSAGTAVLLNFSIARRYRGGKPRVYLPYFTATDLTSAQTWASASRSSLLTSWSAFIASAGAALPGGTSFVSQVNVGYYKGFTNYTGPTGREKARSTVNPDGPTVDPIVATLVNEFPGSQRRRNRAS